MDKILELAKIKKKNISEANLNIFNEINHGDKDFYYTTTELETILNNELIDLNLTGLANRTRSKIIKQSICEALGYNIPNSFPKTQPRFLGQNFDVYGQKSDNLQIWNEEISPSRRYVLIGINDENIIEKIKVLSGAEIATYDTTGKLTSKHQAILKINDNDESKLISNHDTENLSNFISHNAQITSSDNPKDYPTENSLMPISSIYDSLIHLVDTEFNDFGRDQERRRGEHLQKMVCKQLGYSHYGDAGNLPDLRHQLLEIKLQTSPTIDLGAFSPDSDAELDLTINEYPIQVKDIRYAVFNADVEDEKIKIKHLFLTTGEDFFTSFTKMEGKSVNTKIQMALPKDLLRK